MDLATKLQSRRSLDVVIILDVTDDEIFRRAVTQVEESQKEDHTFEQVDVRNSLTDASYGQLVSRLAGFLDSWSLIESYFLTYQPSVQIVHVEAGGQLETYGLERSITANEVLEKVEHIAQSFLNISRQVTSSVEPSEPGICTPLCTKIAKGDTTDNVVSH